MGARAPAAVALHIFHGTMTALFQPGHQARFVFGQVDARDAELLEAQLAAPLSDRAGELGVVMGRRRRRTWCDFGRTRVRRSGILLTC